MTNNEWLMEVDRSLLKDELARRTRVIDVLLVLTWVSLLAWFIWAFYTPMHVLDQAGYQWQETIATYACVWAIIDIPGSLAKFARFLANKSHDYKLRRLYWNDINKP